MGTLKQLFLEQPLALYVALFFAEALCLLALWRRRTRRALLVCSVPVVLAAAVFVLSTLVVTQRERLMGALESLRTAVLAGDGAAIASWLDDNYDDRVYNKEGAAAAAQRAARRLNIESIHWSRQNLKVEIREDKAQISGLEPTVRISQAPVGRMTVHTQWQLWWIHRPSGWRLVSSRLEEPEMVAAPRGPRTAGW
jgi:hypothetical protein